MTSAFSNTCMSQQAFPIPNTSSARESKISKSFVLRCWLSLLQNYAPALWLTAQPSCQSHGQLLSSASEAGR